MNRCVALDINGKQCRRTAIGLYSYHGESELYGGWDEVGEPSWVVAAFCEKHTTKDETHEQGMARMRLEQKKVK